MGRARDATPRNGRSGAEPPQLGPLHGALGATRYDPDLVVLHSGWSRLAFQPLGDVAGTPLEGFVHGDTRYVGRYVVALEGRGLRRTVASVLGSDRWCGVFVDAGAAGAGDLPIGVVPRGALELTVHRALEGGWAEALELVNHGGSPVDACLRIELACPLDDVQYAEEMKREDGTPPGAGCPPRVEHDAGETRLVFRRELGRRAHAPRDELRAMLGDGLPRDGDLVARELRLALPRDASVDHAGGTTTVRIARTLAPRGAARVTLRFTVVHDDRARIEAPDPRPREALPAPPPPGAPHATRIRTASAALDLVLAQARDDLHALSLPAAGPEGGPEVLVAGVPRYVGVFGRDVLTAAWQAALFSPRFMIGALDGVARYAGVRYDAFRDEEPGRLLHERRLDFDSELGARNRELYYGDVASTPFFVVTLANAYHWTGDRALVDRFRPALEGACRFLERRLDVGGGFVVYAPASEHGNRHHAWKDSGDAIVDGRGRIQGPPIAAVEVQGYCHLALLAAAELMVVTGDPRRAAALVRRARDLAARFHRAFYLPHERFYAVGLDARGAPIDAIASNVGHCLGCRIVPASRAGEVVARLLSDGMFSGWGVRTLDASNPAYDPFSYHRGSVWPVENATIAAGMRLLGFEDECERIVAAQLAAATLFDRMRLPEAMTGHPRSPDRPIPGCYPYSNPLQAWSVSAIPFFVQVLLGVRAAAPLRTLLVKPRLPAWLPWLELRDLRVGSAIVSLEFERTARGRQRWRVLAKDGPLRVIEATTLSAIGRRWAGTFTAGPQVAAGGSR